MLYNIPINLALGQHNDGFVRCPEEALTWHHRKFLIVQEILQNQPDVVCLQVFIRNPIPMSVSRALT